MKSILTYFLVAALTCLNVSCATERKKKFEESLKAGQCEAAFENIPEHDKTLKYIGKVDRAAQTTLSYAATGAGYVSDVLLTVVGGTVVLVALCAPIAIAGVMGGAVVGTHNVDWNGAECLPMPFEPKLPTNGKKIYRATEEMRCPDLTALSRSIRKVAGCHEHSTEPGAIEKAQTTLRSLATNKDFMNCITAPEKALVQMDLDRVTNKVQGLQR